MKAIVYYRFGSADVLEYKEIEKPTAGDGEVLIKVHAAAVNPLDWRLLHGASTLLRMLFRLPKPTSTKPGRPGRDVAGVVEAVGKNVTQYKPGDKVYGMCNGAFAEYACASESSVVIKPDNVTFDQAACVPVVGLSSLQGLRDKGKIQPGQKILINGAAGGMGTFSVQIGKSFGADVTAVCSTRNADMVRSLGADRVVDYTQQDFTKSEQRYDLILDNVGNRSLSDCRRVLSPKGICVLAGAPKEPWMFMIRAMTASALSLFRSQKFVLFIAKRNKKDLETLSELMAAGKVTPVIDRRFKLSDAADAIRYLEAGHARAKVVLTLENS